jgi:hypothetical protein
MTFKQIVNRINEIRNAGSNANSFDLLTSPVKISANDYLLMGCDNSSARRNYPHLSRSEREQGVWYAGADDLPEIAAGHNLSGQVRDDGTIKIDSFYTNMPRPEFQAAPEEVAWHYTRIVDLRAQGMPQEQRIETMTREAKTKPWLSM